MGWFIRERRSITWTDKTLESISAPPAGLVVFFFLVILLLFLASYSDYRAQMEKTKIGFRLFMVLLPLVLILMVLPLMMANRWLLTRLSTPARQMMKSGEGGSPWGLAIWVVLLLVMVHYHSSFQSSWFRTF